MSSHGEASTIAEGSVSFALDPSDAAACLESIERASAPPDDSAKMAILEGTLPSPPTEVVERYEYAHVRSSSAAGYGCSGARRSAGVATVTPSIVERRAARCRPARGEPVTNMPPCTSTSSTDGLGEAHAVTICAEAHRAAREGGREREGHGERRGDGEREGGPLRR